MGKSEASPPTSREEFEIAIICTKPFEYDAVCLLVDDFWDVEGDRFGRAQGDFNAYTTGHMGGFNVVVVLLCNTGKVTAASAAASLRSSYPCVRLVLLAGICDGVPTAAGKELLLGDVVVSHTIVQYDLGSLHADGFLTKDTVEDCLGRPNKDIRNFVGTIVTPDFRRARLEERAAFHLDQIQNRVSKEKYRRRQKATTYEYPGSAHNVLFPSTYGHRHYDSPHCVCATEDTVCDESRDLLCNEIGCDQAYQLHQERLDEKKQLESSGQVKAAQDPFIFVGKFGSGDTVFKSAIERDRVAQQHGIIAFEMEGAGVWDELPCIVVKGVHSYGDGHMSRDWREFAAATAASVVKGLIERYPRTDKSTVKVLEKLDADNILDTIQRGLASLEVKVKNIAMVPDSGPDPVDPVDPVECLRALFITDPFFDRARLITTKGEVVQGTCDWVVEKKNLFNGTIPLAGFSGSRNHAHPTTKGQVVIYFFCEHKDKSLNNAASIVRGLMIQLLHLKAELINHVLPTYKIQGDRLFHEDSFEALWSIFLNMANDLGTAQVSCVFDGLDECKPTSLEPLLFKLNKIKDTAPRFRAIVMSREYPKCLGDSLGQFPRIRLDPDAKTEVNHGLEHYISARVAELAECGQYPDELTIHVQETLRQKSNGTYLWISFVIKDLRAVPTSDVEEKLKKLLQGLDELYERILQDVEPNQRDLVRNILRWCTLAARPLALGELVAALGIEPTGLLDQAAVLRGKLTYCGHFLSVTETAVTLVHQSAYDFLTRRPSSAKNNIWFSLSNIEKEHSKLASTCLTHLQNGRLEDEDRLYQDVVDKPEELGNNLLLYAGTYWDNHFRLSVQCGFRILDENPGFFDKKSLALKMWVNWRLKYPFERNRLKSFGKLSLPHIAAEFQLEALIQRIIERNWWHMRASSIKLPLEREACTPLHLAASNGCLSIVETLVKNNMPVDAKDRGGYTPLSCAADHGYKDVVEYLLESGASVGALANRYGPLRTAIRGDHLEVVKLLLEWKADINMNRKYAMSLLGETNWANIELSIFLLEYFAAKFRSKPSVLSSIVYFNRENALTSATEKRNIPAMRLLLDRKWGIDCNKGNRLGKTPLHYAALNGHLEAVQLLLAQPGVDFNHEDYDRNTPLHYAGQNGHLEAVQLLLAQPGIDLSPKDKNHKTPLHMAASNSNHEVIRLLLAQPGIDLNPKDKNHKIPLYYAAQNGHPETVQLLLMQPGINPNQVDNTGKDPLYWALVGGRVSVVRLLAEEWHMPLPECTDKNLYSAIHLASMSSRDAMEKVRLLVDKFGADPQVRTLQGELVHRNTENYFSQYETPLSLAIEKGNVEVAKFFLAECNVDPKAPCRRKDGATPLHLAAQNFNAGLVKILITRYGADVNCLDGQQRTPLHSVTKESPRSSGDDKGVHRRQHTIQILLEAGAEISLKDANGCTAQDLLYVWKIDPRDVSAGGERQDFKNRRKEFKVLTAIYYQKRK
ncbi:Ankyrin-3-like protein [Cladobotryum mycophilum]|uniref:Ankyrin-3-like protein n=1 Tax=Cladobotryum mycophilum TaxID=491253 RepID=A0ABR0SY38_9HYPO